MEEAIEKGKCAENVIGRKYYGLEINNASKPITR